MEQLVAEWYAYKGFFVRTNIKFGKRPKGGYEGEMDVVAFEPKDQVLIHIETSADSDSWDQRKTRFQRKFRSAKKHYKNVFKWNYAQVKQIAVVGYSEIPRNVNFGRDISIMSIPKLMEEIKSEIKHINPTNAVIPEGYGLLRAIQFATAM